MTPGVAVGDAAARAVAKYFLVLASSSDRRPAIQGKFYPQEVPFVLEDIAEQP